MYTHEAILLLGSNIGNTEENLLTAIAQLEKRGGKIIKKSKIQKTLPVEFDSRSVFHNMALVYETSLSPIRLLESIKEIEKEMGREEDSAVLGGYQDRIIDIDIVSYDGITFYSKRLELPHYKHLHCRDFSKELLEDLQQ